MSTVSRAAPVGAARVPLPRLLGPAFVAAIAYLDPGNFATTVAAGAADGYLLIWVVLAANLMAFLVQHLAARLGVATGAGLCELVRDRCRPWVTRLYWGQAEIVCAATDLAEIVGAAIALRMLFGVPLPLGGMAAVGFSLLVLALAGRNQVVFERVIALAVGLILLAFAAAGCIAGISVGAAATGLVPSSAGGQSLLLVTGIMGATIMPHAVYTHSALTPRIRRETLGERQSAARSQRADVGVAMTLAGLGNIAILAVAAASLHGRVGADVSLDDARAALSAQSIPLGLLFAVALLLSGLAASGVGTLAGQVVMSGLLRRQFPQSVRRLATAVPALLILFCCPDPTKALLLSQVALSFGLPFALVPLVLATRKVSVMGDWAVGRTTAALGAGCVAVIVGLNAVLIWSAR